VVSYDMVNKTEWFIQKMSTGWFSRKEIVELAATEFPNISGRVLRGTIGQYWTDCTNKEFQTFKAIRARGFRVMESDLKRHIEREGAL